MTDNDRDFIQSIERGFAVLTSFDSAHPNPTMSEIADTTNLSRPAIRRILLTLQRLGYVSHNGTRWSLTPRVLSIGQHYSASHSLTDAATPHLLAVVEQTHESASLGVLDGTDVVYAARVPVRRIMSINVSVGTRVPAYATSMGKALLAWAPSTTVRWMVANTQFEQLAAGTITSAEQFEAELHVVRDRGYALTAEELEQGLISLAAPVRDVSGDVVGVIACSTSTARYSPEEFRDHAAETVVAAAAALSAEFGMAGDTYRYELPPAASVSLAEP